jgi:acetylglutamate kinase
MLIHQPMWCLTGKQAGACIGKMPILPRVCPIALRRFLVHHGSMSTLLNKTITLFLESIGRREEYEFYLRKFQTDRHPCFAILCPDRTGFEDISSFFAFDIQFLLQLELSPLIVLGDKNASDMKSMLFAGDHPYRDLVLEETGTSWQSLPSLLADNRTAGKAPVISAAGLEVEDMLPRLIPGVARRLHFIRSRGPLHTAGGDPLYYYYTARPNPAEVGEEDRPLVQFAARLQGLRPGTHISVTSPWSLLQELFTVKGAGCVIRRGSEIRRITDFSTVERDRLAALWEDSFRRTLSKPLDLGDRHELYLEAQYRGAALLERTEKGSYLSKFAVGTEARGEGLAFELWQEVCRDHERLFWRAGPDNPINHWYEKQADGYHRQGRWKVYWRGVNGADLPEILRFSLDRPDDFLD